jgi:DNA-directed RNA polymerase delta subunit
MSTTAATSSSLAQVLDEIFLVLSEKEREVLTRRFALAGDSRQTLEAIGQHFDVTRERVRQIESTALQKLRRTIGSTKLKTVNEIAKNILEKNGGVCLEKTLISEVLNSIHSVSDIDGNIIRLSLAVDEGVRKQDRTHQFKPFWRNAKITSSDLTTVCEKAISVLGKSKDLTEEAALVNAIRAALANSGKNFKNEMIASCLPLDHQMKKVDSSWGLMNWRHINPRSIRDKALIIMKKQQKPMHFVEIANAITDYGFDNKVVTVQAVHNELIRDENFVLIGRGLYALKEWGYSGGTVAEVIEDLLAKKTEMSKEEIIRGVLKVRQVKKGTISLNLQKTPWFVRTGRAVYKLDLSKKKGAAATKKTRGGRR